MASSEDPATLVGQFEAPYGLPAPIGQYALVAARHMHEYGTRHEQLAEVAVAARRWAALNPKAWLRELITVEDVLASQPICEPLHKLDCRVRTDGGGAIVVTGEERARDAAKRPVRVLGAGEGHTHWQAAQMPDLTVSAGMRSAQAAFAMAGMTIDDVDVFERTTPSPSPSSSSPRTSASARRARAAPSSKEADWAPAATSRR
jgi:acetyl-CoA acetyltransferase